jgi:hypothetical protein
MYRDRLDTHFVASAVNAKGDLATIGNQQLFDGHFGSLSR